MKRALQQIKEEVASSKPSEISNNNLVTKEGFDVNFTITYFNYGFTSNDFDIVVNILVLIKESNIECSF